MNDKILMAGPSITDHEINKINLMMKDGWDSYQYVEEFESRFANYHQRKYCLMTSCCTHAIHLGLLGLNLEKHDEIIVPECTWTGSVAPVTYLQCKPVFVDISLEDWCLDYQSVVNAITEKTKAIICVDLYGFLPNYSDLENLCKEKNITLIEDAAEALGSSKDNKKAGKFGYFSVHSFHRTKTITTGEGGALLTDDHNFYKRCKFLRDHGRSESIPYYIEEPTPKYMPSNFMGALACAQLDRIEELISIKRNIRDMYIEELSEMNIKMSIIKDNNKFQNGCWATTLVIHNDNFNKNKAINYFNNEGIPLRPFFNALTTMPAYKKYENKNIYNQNAHYLSNRGITLASHYSTNKNQIKLISQTLKNFLKNI